MTELKDKDFKVFDLFKNRWALATAGTLGSFNSCTIGWGSLGTVWATRGKSGDSVTVYLHPSRYTCEFFRENDYFTVSFFPEECRKALAYMGAHSGRDGDKPSACGLTPKAIAAEAADGPAPGAVPFEGGPAPEGMKAESVTYEEAELTFLCRKVCQQPLGRDALSKDIRDYYENAPKAFPVDEDGWHPHWMFIGEIVKTEDNRD